jgi:hypothetical protein
VLPALPAPTMPLHHLWPMDLPVLEKFLVISSVLGSLGLKLLALGHRPANRLFQLRISLQYVTVDNGLPQLRSPARNGMTWPPRPRT